MVEVVVSRTEADIRDAGAGLGQKLAGQRYPLLKNLFNRRHPEILFERTEKTGFIHARFFGKSHD
jgi:hypothetical protein